MNIEVWKAMVSAYRCVGTKKEHRDQRAGGSRGSEGAEGGGGEEID